MNKEQDTSDTQTANTLAETGRNNPDLPAGDSPPLPGWPLYGTVILWLLWIGFLMAMVAMRFNSSGG